ncbi:PLP-dependent aminotransferase family protein [Chloroflexota bacterium]
MKEPMIVQSSIPPNFIDLGNGNPDINLLPLEMLQQSAERFFADGDRRSLQYGLEQGDGYFREALADFLTTAYDTKVDSSALFVTSGASSGLDLLCTLFAQPGDTVFVEEPSYFLALRIFEDHGLRVVSIPIDEDGLNLDELEGALAEYKPKLIYTIPTFQNPSGRSLPQARRDKLAALAQKHNFLIAADEVYQLLPYTQTPPRAFAAMAEDVEQVVSVNSFSKILAPGLRLGWIQAHGSVIKRMAGSGLLESGGGMTPYTSALVRGLIEDGGLERNISRLRKEYAVRLRAMDAALHQYLPAAEYALPHGGFFFWVRLPGANAAELRSQAQRFEVGLRQGDLFSSRNGLQDYVRLSFSYYRPEAIEEGVKRLGDCVRFGRDN